MIFVALALAALLALTVAAFGRIIQSLLRSHARERDLLINQLLHTVGKDWTPAPADEWQPPRFVEDEAWPTWRASPEQLPVSEQGASE